MNIGIDIYNKVRQYIVEDASSYILSSNYDDGKKVDLLNKLEDHISDEIVKDYMINKIKSFIRYEKNENLKEYADYDRGDFSDIGRYISGPYRDTVIGLVNASRVLGDGTVTGQADRVVANVYSYLENLSSIQQNLDRVLTVSDRVDYGNINYRKGEGLLNRYVYSQAEYLIASRRKFDAEDKVMTSNRNPGQRNVDVIESMSNMLLKLEAHRVSFYVYYTNLIKAIRNPDSLDEIRNYVGENREDNYYLNDKSISAIKSFDNTLDNMFQRVVMCRNVLKGLVTNGILDRESKFVDAKPQPVTTTPPSTPQPVTPVAPPPEKKSFIQSIKDYVNPSNWNLKYIGASAVVISVAALAYFAWKKWTNSNCNNLTGDKLEMCRIKAIDKAIERAKGEIKKCNKALSPEKCKREIVELIKTWNKRRQDIYSNIGKTKDFE